LSISILKIEGLIKIEDSGSLEKFSNSTILLGFVVGASVAQDTSLWKSEGDVWGMV